MMKLKIQLFGAFRNFGDKLSLAAEEGVTVSDLRPLVFESLTKLDPSFDDEELLFRSRFATEHEVLCEHAVLDEDMKLAIIPPVSGG